MIKTENVTTKIECDKTDCNNCVNHKYCDYEPTTKNDLGVDCIVDVLGSYTDLDIPYKREIAENILTKLSSVTPIRPKGHWIVAKGGSYLGIRNACCSNCRDFYTNDWAYMNYCPNCGSDNREVEK